MFPSVLVPFFLVDYIYIYMYVYTVHGFLVEWRLEARKLGSCEAHVPRARISPVSIRLQSSNGERVNLHDDNSNPRDGNKVLSRTGSEDQLA